jgi:hypothetical protein
VSTRKRSVRAETERSRLLARVLDWINSGEYDEEADYILFGRSSIFDLIDEMAPGKSGEGSDVNVTHFVSDLTTEVGRRVVSERTSIGERPKLRKLRGLGDLSKFPPEKAALVDRLVQPAKPRDPSDVIDAKYAHEIIAKLPKIVDRATRLSAHKVSAEAVSETAIRHHFEEAHACYLYGFNAACAVLCRTILETALKARFDPQGKIEAGLPKGRSRNC